jgi:hypothetical protein
VRCGRTRRPDPELAADGERGCGLGSVLFFFVENDNFDTKYVKRFSNLFCKEFDIISKHNDRTIDPEKNFNRNMF